MTLHDALERRPSLARALEDAGVVYAQLEASARSRDGQLETDRMMIERAPRAALDAVLAAFGVPRVEALDALDARAEALGVPRIVGWDGARGCAKLYANASDAPEDVREALGAHVVGVNVTCDGAVEEKRYEQRADAAGLGPDAERLFRAAGSLAAGVVVSRDTGGVRALFVALRPAAAAALDAAFGPHLVGFSWAAVQAAAPFAPASPRSIGIAAGRPDEWTVYFKPKDADAPALSTLEPLVRVRLGDAEVAVYVEPRELARRAYAVTDELAVSYRVVRGAPSSTEVRALMDALLAALPRDPTLASFSWPREP